MSVLEEPKQEATDWNVMKLNNKQLVLGSESAQKYILTQ